MGDDEKSDSTEKSEAQQEIAASGGKVPETANSLFTLRQLCDEHAILLAKGEQEIRRFLGGVFERFAADVKQAVALEQAQCELLLRLEQPIPHGQRADWKWELAQSLNNSRLGIGNRFSVSGIEERLTRARAAEREPGYWVRIESACLTTKSLNFRSAMKTLKAADSEEEEQTPKQPQRDPGAGGGNGAAGEGEGGDDDDDDDNDDEGGGLTGDKLHDGVPMSAIPTEELEQLRSDVDAADKIEAERDALRAEIETLRAKVGELDDLKAKAASAELEVMKRLTAVDVSIDKPGKVTLAAGQTVGIPAGATAMKVHKARSHTEEMFSTRKTPKIQRLPRAEAEIEFLTTSATKESHDVH